MIRIQRFDSDELKPLFNGQHQQQAVIDNTHTTVISYAAVCAGDDELIPKRTGELLIGCLPFNNKVPQSHTASPCR